MFGSFFVVNVKIEIVYELMLVVLYLSFFKGLLGEFELFSIINFCYLVCFYSVVCLGKDMVFIIGDNCIIEGI